MPTKVIPMVEVDRAGDSRIFDSRIFCRCFYQIETDIYQGIQFLDATGKLMEKYIDSIYCHTNRHKRISRHKNIILKL